VSPASKTPAELAPLGHPDLADIPRIVARPRYQLHQIRIPDNIASKQREVIGNGKPAAVCIALFPGPSAAGASNENPTYAGKFLASGESIIPPNLSNTSNLCQCWFVRVNQIP
jgi:hypothetical protein